MGEETREAGGRAGFEETRGLDSREQSECPAHGGEGQWHGLRW